MTSEGVSEEQRVSHPSYIEELGLNETANLLAAVGNHEAKALLLLYLAANAGYHTASQMSEGFTSFLGPEAIWHPSKNLPFNYCVQSLAPIGQVVKGGVEGRRGVSPAYAISEQGFEKGIPLVGWLLDWSLRYPDISIQKIFGSTATNGELRAPERRLAIFLELLTSPIPDIAISDLVPIPREEENYDIQLGGVGIAAASLEAAGLVTVDHVVNHNDKRFRILSTEIPREELPRGPITRALYDFLKVCSAKGITEFEFEEARRYVTAALEGSVPAPKIRHHLGDRLNERQYHYYGKDYIVFPGIQRIGGPFNKARLTKIHLVEAHREALYDVLNIVLASSDNAPSYREGGKQLAHGILNSKQAVQTLIAKAYRFSGNAQKLSFPESAAQLRQILEEAGEALDLAQVHRRYREKFPRPIGENALAVILRKMGRTGMVDIERKPVDPSRVRERVYYSSAVGRMAGMTTVDVQSSD